MLYAEFDNDGLPIIFFNDEFDTPSAGAVSITESQYLELINNVGQRRWNGVDVEAYTPENAALSYKKEEAKLAIDYSAEQARARYATQNALQSMVYLEKAAQAEKFIENGYPTDLFNYLFIQAEMDATGKTKEEAADGIIAARDSWISIGSQVERHRLGGKKNVDDALDTQQVTDAMDMTISLLESI